MPGAGRRHPDPAPPPDRRSTLPRWMRLPLAVAAGVVMGLGQAPYDLWICGLAGLVAAFWLFRVSPRGGLAAGTGWAFGLGYFGFSMGWIVEPFLVDAAETGWMAPFGLIGLAGGLALFWGLAFWGAARARRYAPAALVLSWTAAELARGYVLTGFPWANVSYLWLPTPVMQWAALVGPYGLTALTLALAALLAEALPPAPRARAGLAGGALGAVLLAVGWALLPPLQALDGRPVVRLIQPNAPQDQKWDPDMVPVFFNRQVEYTEAPPAEGQEPPTLILWSETALPMLLHNAGDALGLISHVAGAAQVVVGIQREEMGRWHNSLVLMDAEGDLAQVYDKHHLVPFGEYMPAAGLFARWNIAGLAARAEGGYSAGPGPELLDLGPLGSALPLICYEAVFPQDVHRAPARPEMLMQLTNDAWFGQFSGPYQHLAQARIRAIEQGLPMLRSANTGVSAVIDGAGRVLASLPLGEAGFLDAPLPPPLRMTPYARTGDLPVFLLILLGAGCAVFTAWKGRARKPH
ncbi:apolipoprotein N-acyltransferase [Ponticoccus sp. (in: a-proteobacteria)]|uniref:apolipoprotein N-acyltransferase n=1 Tax=Ponticoccus sp. (in: a-proteobacteria) TaxID=1925025 RepID=UPI003AB26056